MQAYIFEHDLNTKRFRCFKKKGMYSTRSQRSRLIIPARMPCGCPLLWSLDYIDRQNVFLG